MEVLSGKRRPTTGSASWKSCAGIHRVWRCFSSSAHSSTDSMPHFGSSPSGWIFTGNNERPGELHRKPLPPRWSPARLPDHVTLEVAKGNSQALEVGY